MEALIIVLLIIGSIIVIALLFAAVFGVALIEDVFEYLDDFRKDE